MVDQEKNAIIRIDSVWMAVSVDIDGMEGVCAVYQNGMWMPLLAADEKRLPFILEKAAMIARERQQLIRIVRLNAREAITEFDGRQ
jgi:hypothetical protein